MQNLRFFLAAVAACALCACDPEVLFKIYPGGTVVVNRNIAIAPGADACFGLETEAARNCTYVEGLEGVQLVESPRQGAFSAIHGFSIPYQIGGILHKDCDFCLPDWRICYRAALNALGVDSFSFDYHSATGCVVRYTYVVYIL